ncbi:MAG: cation diffusion facilitator family transporter [Actinomycetota bacterium]|jgi:cation diffusion facilitator family transporter|nr:cation diffusion facilitator family transporter [Actinomycetota bacterium]
MQEGSRKAIAAAFLANLGIAIAKFAGFAVTGAASLLAEALHSVADTGNQALLFLGGRRARRGPTPEHPFGYGRERYFWAFVVALMLFSLGALFAVYEGIDKLIHPHQLDSVAIAVAVLGVAIVLEALSFRTAFIEARAVKGDGSWWQFIRRSKSPELPVVLLEDSGALLGLALALVGVSGAELTGNPRWDAVGSIGIGILLGAIAIVLAAEMKSLLIGESATAPMERAIRAAIEDGPEVRRIIHLRTLHLGPDELLVAAKVEVDASSMPDLARAIDTVESRIRASVPIARLIYLEPDVYRPDASVDR